MKALASVKGTGGIVYVYEDRVVISRNTATGWMMQGSKGDRTLYFKDIKTIEYKKPHGLINGYIEFSTTPDLTPQKDITSMASANPDVLILRSFHHQTIIDGEKVYKIAMEQWDKAKQDNSTVKTVSDPADELRKLKGLVEDGIITQNDFDTKKKQLLGL